MFSLEQLLFALGYDQRVNSDALHQMLPMLNDVCEKESAAREQLRVSKDFQLCYPIKISFLKLFINSSIFLGCWRNIHRKSSGGEGPEGQEAAAAALQVHRERMRPVPCQPVYIDGAHRGRQHLLPSACAKEPQQRQHPGQAMQANLRVQLG